MKGIASRTTAIHEAGHCLIGKLRNLLSLKSKGIVGYIKYHQGEMEKAPGLVTIVSRARYLGLNIYLPIDGPEQSDITATKAFIEMALGGGAAIEGWCV